MFTFIVNSESYQFNGSDTILEVKQSLIRQLNLKSNYIDIIFNITRPLRTMGKFNIDIGLLPRTLDRYILDRFSFTETPININYKLIDDYTPIQLNASNSGIYVPRYKRKFKHKELKPKQVINQVITTPYDITNEDEFPSL